MTQVMLLYTHFCYLPGDWDMIGARIAHYEITYKLGEGGMGVVYCARDTKLGRDVALKVLSEAFAYDAQRMGRFEREARVLASLNHPHIASIHGLEESKGVRALVMELVEGPTLADRIAEGPIPLEEALPLARQMAAALEYAHEKGIIHRDLKPTNVKLTGDGVVKILDFGLAKAMEEDPFIDDPENSPTLTLGATKEDVILGTASYMSPEQARGRPADRRSDVWAFGVVLYEMLTGRMLFTGETVSDTLAGVLQGNIDLSSLPEKTPAEVRRLLRRCLERDRNRRLQAIGDARLELEEAAEPEQAPKLVMAMAAKQRWLPWIVAACAAATLAGVSFVQYRQSSAEGPLRKLEIKPPQLDTSRGSFALSPDGGRIAYVAQGRLWIRDFADFDAREVTGSKGAQNPFWSPDSASVAFFAGNGIWQAPGLGAGAKRISSVPSPTDSTRLDLAGGAWTSDGRIVFTTGYSGLLSVPASGGEARPFVDVNAETEEDFHDAGALPDDRGILFVVHRKSELDSLGVSEGNRHKIILTVAGERLYRPVYSSTGHVLYEQVGDAGGIWALPFSLSRLEATGEPFLAFPGAGSPSTAWDGTLALSRGQSSSELVWLNRKGETTARTGETRGSLWDPVLSPDGRSVALTVSGGGGVDAWVYDLARGVRTRVSGAREHDYAPVWSPDGVQLAFTSARAGNLDIFVRRADGTGPEQELVATPNQETVTDWSRDGRYLLYMVNAGSGTEYDLWYLKRGNSGVWEQPHLFLGEPANQRVARLSPDGHYVAYEADDSGEYQIYVRPFPQGDRRWTVSVSGGTGPVWGPDGKELFYLSGDTVMAVEVSTAGGFSAGRTVALFQHRGAGAGLAVSPDSESFLVAGPVDEESGFPPPSIHIVQNWFAEFRDLQ